MFLSVRLLSDPGVSAFGLDPSNGDVLYADVSGNTVRRLHYAPSPVSAAAGDPGRHGCFYEPHHAHAARGHCVSTMSTFRFWSDNAILSRWFYIPTNRTITFRPSTNWSFPTGSVWIQHLELELTNGVAESRQRLETRLLVRENAAAAPTALLTDGIQPPTPRSCLMPGATKLS